MFGIATLGPARARLRRAAHRARQPLRDELALIRRHSVRFAGITGAVAALLGVVVLIGWAAGSVALTHLRAGWPAMQPNAALGLLLCGVSLWLLADEQAGRTARRLAQALATVSMVLGILT